MQRTNKDNFTAVLTHLVDELTLPITRQTINEELQRHPDYSTLLAFSDVLRELGVPNAAYQPEFEKLKNAPVPFIAQLLNNQFAVISKIDDHEVIISNQRAKKKKLPTSEFKYLFSGKILVVQPNEESGEENYKENRLSERIENLRIPVLYIGSAVLLLSFLAFHSVFFDTPNLNLILLMFFKTIGLSVSVILLIQSIDANNPFIKKICGKDNKNCNAILTSNAAKITKQLSWSEVGFFYFSSTWLLLMFNSDHINLLGTIAILNVISLPYTFYSIYYQWRIAKQFCVLCTVVQLVLWAEFFFFFPFLTNLRFPTMPEWDSLIVGFLLPILGWIFIKPYLQMVKRVDFLSTQLRKFKYDKRVFETILSGGNKYSLLKNEEALMLGFEDAKHVITMVSNPFCQPCASTHKLLDEWVEKRDDLKLQLVFYTNDVEGDKSQKIASHFMNLQTDSGAKSMRIVLKDWYEQKHKNYEDWAKAYPVTENVATLNYIKKQREWCINTQVTSTPTLFLNGYKLPDNYRIEDLKYFI